MKNPNKFLLFLFFHLLLCLQILSFAEVTTNVEFNVGVILDLDEVVAKVRLKCMSIALSDFYATHPSYKTRVILYVRNSKKDTITAASAAIDLLKNTEVRAIVGPETSVQTNFLAELGEKSHVPVLSFSVSSIPPSSTQNQYFIRMVQKDTSQIEAIVAIFQAFGWKETIPIYEETGYGNQVIAHLVETFQKNGVRVPYMSAVSSSATDAQIAEELHRLMPMQSKVFVVHATPFLGSRIFLKAKELGMMSEGYSFIITDSLTNVLDSIDPSIIDSMQGVIGVRPYVSKSKELESFTAKLRKQSAKTNHLSIFELWAYDAVWALALAAEEVGGLTYGFQKPEVADNSSYLTSLGVSETGPKLVEAILKTRFKGLSGEYQLVNKQLQSSLFQIVNVIGNQGREIGIWSQIKGIMRGLNVTEDNYADGLNSKEKLRAIIWPGESTKVPKGWSFSTNGRTLKVAVPMKSDFDEFVKVIQDPITNSTKVTGHCIDLFDAVMKELPFEVPYEFIPYRLSSGVIAESYDDMIYQVYLQKFDAMVADTTTTANRSLYADFTLPYGEGGVSMLVRTKGNEKKDGWVFLKPLSSGMWLATVSAFIFTGCTIWVLEHRVNTSFRGSPSDQLAMIFWFSFSTVVFAHRERLMNNLSKLVLIIWVCVVLILTSSYTASLTSMLTIQQLSVGDLNQLITSGEYIGYQRGSFVKKLLNNLNVDDSKLRALSSMDEYAEALSKGSKKGGVSAIFDEIPYLKLFLTKYCANFAMVGPTYDTNGFGFVFSKGSPLVLQVSNAILKVKDEGKITTIDMKWFRNKTSCDDSGSAGLPESLTVDSFQGLFLVTVLISTFALLLFLGCFLHKHWHVITSKNSSGEWQIRKGIVELIKIFYEEIPTDDSETIELNQMN